MQYQTPQPQRQGSAFTKWAIGLMSGCLLAALCLGCLVLLAATSLFVLSDQLVSQPPPPAINGADRGGIADLPETPTPTLIPLTPTSAVLESALIEAATPTPIVGSSPTPAAINVTPDAKPQLDLDPPDQIMQAVASQEMFTSLDNLARADYPAHEFYESAARLGSFALGERTIVSNPAVLGEQRAFFVDENTTQATLLAITAHSYFWVEEGLELDPFALQRAADRFENDYYPQIVELVGSEWSPGVDGDAHFSVLHLAGDLTTSDELGYFNSGDEYPASFYFDSNEQEIIYLNMGNLDLGEDLYFGTLVHEFQHLAHWYVDANETTWMDEGLAQLVELYVGLETAGFSDYLAQPEIRLNSWDYGDDVYAHYSAAYLFMVYLWEQLGDGAIQELARHPANGMVAVDSVLAGFKPELSLQQFVANWAVANLLDDPAAGPEYGYRLLDLGVVHKERNVRELPQETVANLEQFSVHYVALSVNGSATISFAGDTVTELVPVSPFEGANMWYVPAMDALDAQLTQRFDLSGLNEATLSFWAWYDLEPDYDFTYLSVSLDEGETWDLLAPDQARPGDYGPSFTGRSSQDRDAVADGWVPVTVSLNSYVGRAVLVRFETLTDAAVVGQGFALDAITLPELGFFSGAENGDEGWDARGFVQSGRWLPQFWSVQLVLSDSDPVVRTLPLDSFNQGQWTVDLGNNRGGTLVITPLTPFATNAARYWLVVE